MNVLKFPSEETRRVAMNDALRVALEANDLEAVAVAKASILTYSTKKYATVLADISKLPTMKQLIKRGHAHRHALN